MNNEIETRIKEFYSLVDLAIKNTPLTRDQHQEANLSLDYIGRLAIYSFNQEAAKEEEESLSKLRPEQLQSMYNFLDRIIASKSLSRPEHNQLLSSLQWLYNQAMNFFNSISSVENEDSNETSLHMTTELDNNLYSDSQVISNEV